MSESALPPRSFDHVGIAVRSIESGEPLIHLLGGVKEREGTNEAGGFRWVSYRMPGDASFELLAPTTDDSFLHRFLDKRGEGVHHLTFRVDDVEEAAEAAEAAGYRTIGLDTSRDEWKEVFLHPSSAHGTLVEFGAFPDDRDG